MGAIRTEDVPQVHLVGTAGNPARDPSRKRPETGKGSIGDQAFMDAVIVIAVAWLILFALAFSLRSHNV